MTDLIRRFDQGDDNERASIFTGEEELFAFERVMSRMTEMQTQDYWNQREKIRNKRLAKKEERDTGTHPAQVEAAVA